MPDAVAQSTTYALWHSDTRNVLRIRRVNPQNLDRDADQIKNILFSTSHARADKVE